MAFCILESDERISALAMLFFSELSKEGNTLYNVMSLFPYSDRSIKKLVDNFPCWSDKLHEYSVYDSICVIFAGVKKGVGWVDTLGKSCLNVYFYSRLQLEVLVGVRPSS
jgi:hypothetical protein